MDKESRKSSPRPTVKLSDIDFAPVLLALLVVVVTIVLYLLWKKRSPSRSNVLFTGICDAGKTCLFSQLLYNQDRETFTSASENVGEFSNDKVCIRVVDIPGHERLRNKFFDVYKSSAKGLVFVVDSVTLQKDIRDVADYLYTILSDDATQTVPILILCNKQDETLAKGCAVIKSLLEKELNVIRTTRTNQLQSVYNSGGRNQFLGKKDKDFEFAQLSQRIAVTECSAKNRELDSLAEWIHNVA